MPNGTGRRQTVEQARAQHAAIAVGQAEGALGNKAKEYGSLARGLSGMVQLNGLGQTLAFLKAKARGNRAHELVYEHVSQWVSVQLTGTNQDLLDWIITQNSDVYRRAATEALAYVIWLRRFAEAKGWSDDGGDGDGAAG